MADGGRKTRPWARLRGPSGEANDLAALLREWLDSAGLRLDDLLDALEPEHFESQTVPGRSTVADRLAGVNLQWDFVEAVADACSSDTAERERLRQQARPLHEAAKRAQRSTAGKRSGSQVRAVASAPGALSNAAEVTAELVAVQRQSLVLSDKLMRAMQRSAELEKARNDANHMVLLLLTMTDKLHRDIAMLAAQRDRAATEVPGPDVLQGVRQRLHHSEAQRLQAEAELVRARAEREKADRLAERSAEQVSRLTAELARLRFNHDPPPEDSAVPEANESAPSLPARSVLPDDIDTALMKATHILDNGAHRLEQLEEELQCETPRHLDNPEGWKDSPDNSPDNTEISVLIAKFLKARRQGALKEVSALLLAAGREWPPNHVAVALERLRMEDAAEAAVHILHAVGSSRPTTDVVPLFALLPSTDISTVMAGIGAARPPRLFRQALDHLRRSSYVAFAHNALFEAGRLRPIKKLPFVLSSLKGGSEGDGVLVMNALRTWRSEYVHLAVRRLMEVGMLHEAHFLQVAATAADNASPGGVVQWGHEPWFGQPPRGQHEQDEMRSTVLTTRIRIKIPGSRPIPPIIMRTPIIETES